MKTSAIAFACSFALAASSYSCATTLEDGSGPGQVGLDLLWTAKTDTTMGYTGVAVDHEAGVVYASRGFDGHCDVFAFDGRLQRAMPLTAGGGDMLLGLRAVPPVKGRAEATLVRFGVWGEEIVAHEASGALAWKVVLELEESDELAAVNSIDVADLNLDGRSELVVGLNGSDGIWAFREDYLVWRAPGSNVWDVTVGDFHASDGLEVAATTGQEVRILSSWGERLHSFQSGVVNRVAAVPGAGSGPDAILAADHKGTVTLFEPAGGVIWSTSLGTQRVLEIAVNEDLAAIAVSGTHELLLVDLETGSVVAAIDSDGSPEQAAELDWLVTKDGRRVVLLADGYTLEAFAVD